MGYNYADPQAEACHKANPEDRRHGHGERQRRRHARHLRHGPRPRATSAPTTPTPPPAAHRRKAGGGSSARGRGSPAASCGPASTTAASPRPTSGRTSARSTASSTPAGSPRTPSTTTRRGGPNKPVLHLFPHWNWPGLEGQEIAVWVHSNLDRVELFLNGQSLGAKDMKKDQHLAWNVKYAPGTIEARGFKDGKQVMTAKRETTGPAAKLVLAAGPHGDLGRRRGRRDLRGGSAGRAGTGRADHRQRGHVQGDRSGRSDRHRQRRPDQSRTRSRPQRGRRSPGCAWRSCSPTKTAGSLKVEATSPGLTAATATITSKAVKLRPQVAVWEREVPTGAGITGLWRPVTAAAAAQTDNPMALAGGQRGLGVYLPPERKHADGLGGIFGRRRFWGTRRPAGRADRRRQDGRIQSLLPHRDHDLHRNHQRRSDRTAPHRRSGRTRRAWRRTSRGRDRSAPGHRPPARRQRSLIRRRRRRARWAAGTGAYRLAAGRALGHCDRSSLSILTDLLVDFTIVWYFRRIGSSSVTADFFQSSVENARVSNDIYCDGVEQTLGREALS